MKKYFLLTIIVITMLPLASHAATLRFEPPLRAAQSGDVVETKLHLDVAPGECVNAAQVSLTYPKDLLSPNVLSHGESIFTIWMDENIDRDAAKITFTGGVPGGYCGRANGDPGESNIIAKLAFQYKGNPGETRVASVGVASDTQITLNDGQGTLTSVAQIPLQVVWSASSTSRNEWLDEVAKDTFPPETFIPRIMKDDSDPHSPFYLFFETDDKQSGVEHYEVLEDDPSNFGFHFGNHVKAKFARATSPYVLQDQTLSSRIVVRAYDFAGNYEEAILPPKNVSTFFGVYAADNIWVPIIIGGMFALVLVGGIMWWRRSHRMRDDLDDIIDESGGEN